jgi:hypothetical protein
MPALAGVGWLLMPAGLVCTGRWCWHLVLPLLGALDALVSNLRAFVDAILYEERRHLVLLSGFRFPQRQSGVAMPVADLAAVLYTDTVKLKKELRQSETPRRVDRALPPAV